MSGRRQKAIRRRILGGEDINELRRGENQMVITRRSGAVEHDPRRDLARLRNYKNMEARRG